MGAVHAEKLEIKDLVLTANLGRSSRDEAYEQIVIRIRSEYHQRFLDALNEARRKYKKQSKLEIKTEFDINGIQYSLVISIWDEDSSSRDDLMAGITVPLK